MDTIPEDIVAVIFSYLPLYLDASELRGINRSTRDLVLKIEQDVDTAMKSTKDWIEGTGHCDYVFFSVVCKPYDDISREYEIGESSYRGSIYTDNYDGTSETSCPDRPYYENQAQVYDIMTTALCVLENVEARRSLTIGILTDRLIDQLLDTIECIPIVQEHAWVTMNLACLDDTDSLYDLLVELMERYETLDVTHYHFLDPHKWRSLDLLRVETRSMLCTINSKLIDRLRLI